MEGPRGLKAHEFESLCTLINTVFRGNGVGRMEEQYPLLFATENFDQLFVMVEDGVVVSHVGALTRDISVLGCRMSTMSIGAVATYASHRGRGLATRVDGSGDPEGGRTGRRAHAHIGRQGALHAPGSQAHRPVRHLSPFPGTRCPPVMARPRVKWIFVRRNRRTCTK